MNFSLHFLLLLLHLQGLHLLSLILTIQLLSNGTNLFFCFNFGLGEQFLITGKYFLHLFFEIKIFIALDRFIIFHPL